MGFEEGSETIQQIPDTSQDNGISNIYVALVVRD